MFGVGFDVPWLLGLRSMAAVFCVAFAVKLMDDFMDLRADIEMGVPSVASRLGESTLPYAMMLLALAALFDGKIAVPLFTASYAVGMAFDLNRMLPSGLYGWQEGAVAVAAGAILAGPLGQLWAFLAIAFVQCMDDIADSARDGMSGSANLVRRFGLGEVRMAALALFVLAAWINPFLTAVVVLAVACVEGALWRMATYRSYGASRVPHRGWTD